MHRTAELFSECSVCFVRSNQRSNRDCQTSMLLVIYLKSLQFGNFRMSHLQEDDQCWQLKVEKRILSTRTLAFDKTSKENNLLLTVSWDFSLILE